MFDEVVLGSEFFEGLERADAQIAEIVRASPCAHCGGPLHVSNYGRKPRGGLVAAAGESHVRRFSLCCGHEGCRRRATPPSVRFLGRRVYLEAVVIIASVLAVIPITLGQSTVRRAVGRGRIAGAPARTVRRWLAWWSGPFVKTAVFVALRARLVTVDVASLPRAILDHLGGSGQERVERMSQWLSPLTTQSWGDGSRFPRGRP
jgi:hypothetical protein